MEKEKKTAISAIFNVIGGVSGFITLLSVVLVGGQYTKQVDVNTQDIASIKQYGSPSQQAHEKLDAERVEALKSRVTTIENAVIILADVKGQLAVLNERIATLSVRITSLEAATNGRKP